MSAHSAASALVLDGASADDLAVVFAANDQSDAIATLLHSLAKLWPLWGGIRIASPYADIATLLYGATALSMFVFALRAL